MTSHGRFNLNIPTAVKEQLIARFDLLEPAKLTIKHLDPLKKGEGGVYLLYQSSLLVYVGQAKRLRRRLEDHRLKLESRQNIKAADVAFKCLYVDENWSAFGPEKALMTHYRSVDRSPCEWNGNGFGPHDPGRRREETNKPAEGFDNRFPIRPEFPCASVQAGDRSVLELLLELKGTLPFLLRFQLDPGSKSFKRGHADYRNATVDVPKAGMPANELMRLIVEALPTEDGMPAWQATTFPSHFILYKERRDYQFGDVI